MRSGYYHCLANCLVGIDPCIMEKLIGVPSPPYVPIPWSDPGRAAKTIVPPALARWILRWRRYHFLRWWGWRPVPGLEGQLRFANYLRWLRWARMVHTAIWAAFLLAMAHLLRCVAHCAPLLHQFGFESESE